MEVKRAERKMFGRKSEPKRALISVDDKQTNDVYDVVRTIKRFDVYVLCIQRTMGSFCG